MLIPTVVLLFIFGLMIGSFLNVVIYRLEGKKRKGLGGRSFCPKCGEEIRWYDNVPVISWLVLGGKCRNCNKLISVQYPLVELATGLAFAVVGWFFVISDSGQARMTHALFQSAGQAVGLFFWLFFASCLIIIFVYDLKHQIIPDEIIYTALLSGLIYVSINFAFLSDFGYLTEHLLSGLLAGGFFYALAAVSKGKWMGGGDIKLVAFMGLVLGLQGILVALYVAFILGALVGVFLLLGKKKKISSRIPFGPFLVIGTFVGFLFGEQIVNVYINMFL